MGAQKNCPQKSQHQRLFRQGNCGAGVLKNMGYGGRVGLRVGWVLCVPSTVSSVSKVCQPERTAGGGCLSQFAFPRSPQVPISAIEQGRMTP